MRTWLIEVSVLVLTGVTVGAFLADRVQAVLVAAGLVGNTETYRSSVGDMTIAVVALIACAIGGGVWAAAWEIRRLDLAEGLSGAFRSITASQSRAQKALLVSQVAISSALLFAAGLFVASHRNARVTPLGFSPNGLFVAWANTGAAGYSVQETDRLFRDLASRVRTIPGVANASVGVSIPFLVNLGERVFVPGREEAGAPAYVDVVTPGHLETLGVPLRRGRGFSALLDLPGGSPSVILSEALAHRLFGSGEALGRCIVVTVPPCRFVVGVSGDLLQVNLRTPVLHVYLPLEQNVELLPSRALFVRVRSGDTAAVASVHRSLQNAIPGAPLEIREMADLLAAEIRPWQLSATVLSTFGIISLCISTIGVFGVVSYWTSRRIREIGVRIALGATASRIVSDIVRSVIPATALGCGIGLVLGAAFGRVVSAQLFGITPVDATTALAATLAPLAAAVVASLYPAIVALRANPVKALSAP
jgi:predicted permease